jgi:MMPL family
MNRGVIIRSAAGLAIATFVGISLVQLSDPSVLLWLPIVILFVLIGALLWTRVPSNPIGPMFLVAGILIVASSGFGAYASVGGAASPPWPGSKVAHTLNDILFFYPIMIALIGIPLVFPDGHLPSRRFRWVGGALVLSLATWTVGVLGGPNSSSGSVTDPIVLVSTLIGFAGAVIAVGVRFRGGDTIQRQQIKWLMADAGLAAIAFPLAFANADPDNTPYPALAVAIWLVAILTLLLLPVVIGIAVLRYRLYDIDRIVSRTVSYAVVTGFLAIAFGAMVVTLSTVLAQYGQGASIAVAVSTLAVFTIFQPALRTVRDRVDRRFNRARYDAARTTEAFANRLRDQVEILTVTADLDATVRAAVRPSRLGLWLRPRHGDAGRSR